VTQRVATPEVETNKVFWLVGDGVMEATPDDKSRTRMAARCRARSI